MLIGGRIRIYVKWREGRRWQWRGPFVVPVAAPIAEEAQFDLVLSPKVLLTVDTKLQGSQVGLRPQHNGKPNPTAEVCWGLDLEWLLIHAS